MGEAAVKIRPIQARANQDNETGSLAVLAAGGTGGHVFPAEAFARELVARGWRVMLVTDGRGSAYSQAFPESWIRKIRMDPLRKKTLGAMLSLSWQLCAGVLSIWYLFGKTRPALVAGFGGYAAAPVLIAARLRRIPFILHEQNAVLGKVNRLFAPRANILACGFERLEKLPVKAADRVHVVGNPVRPDIAVLHEQPSAPLGETCQILVTGGSQGAASLGRIIPEAMALLPEALRVRLRVCQQVRADQIEEVHAHFSRIGVRAEIAAFFGDMAVRLQKAHFVIARSGASSVSEIALSGRPAILIPLPDSADAHQQANAEVLSQAGAACLIAETPQIVEALAQKLEAWAGDSEALVRMSKAARLCAYPNAAGNLANLAERAVGSDLS